MRARTRTVLRTIWVGAGLGITVWMVAGFQASGVPGAALRSDARVSVSSDQSGMHFRPFDYAGHAGLIFLPGGMVEPVAYAPLLHRIAGEGHPAHLVYLPMRCACTDAQVDDLFGRIKRIVEGRPKTRWFVAGHSRGGMLAARFVHENASAAGGLILIGTTHPRDFSLAPIQMPVIKIYGDRDGVAPVGKIQANLHLLPADTRWVPIQGANHVQFGYYRHQFGDGDATISREEQQEALRMAVLGALRASRTAAASNGMTPRHMMYGK